MPLMDAFSNAPCARALMHGIHLLLLLPEGNDLVLTFRELIASPKRGGGGDGSAVRKRCFQVLYQREEEV